MASIIACAVLVLVVLVVVVLVAGVVAQVRGGGGSGAAGRATAEIESLFAPAKRHEVEQQEIVDTTRVDVSNGDGNPLERYTDAAALRDRWSSSRPAD